MSNHPHQKPRKEELAFLNASGAQTEPVKDIGQNETPPVQHKAFFRQGHKPDTSDVTQKLFVVLRGLPGCDSTQKAYEIMFSAIENKVKSMAVLSTQDFFYNDRGEFVFDKDKMTENHKKNYDRSVMHFVIGTELIILNNYNIKKSHYCHYVQSAVNLGYDVMELVCGKVNGLTDDEFQALHEATGRHVPESIIRNYAKTFEA